MPKADFKIERFLGKGSYGSVSLVTRLSDSKQYALKEINVSHMAQRDRSDQLNEIRILASIYHPNVLGYYECFIENGKLCIVTDFCGQGDLEKLINQHTKSKTKIPEALIWNIIMQTLNGLQAIHKQFILHRDIKSQNILIQNDTYKIADFGVSKVQHKANDLARTAIGTPFYLSPEMWKQEQYSQKTDVYSLGCLFYELCMLKHPYTGRDVKELQRNVLRGIYQPVHTFYSQDLRDLITSMLSASSLRRPNVNQIIHSAAIQSRKEIYPALFEETILAGQNTALEFGMTSILEAPKMIQTIKINPMLNRIMNGQIGGGANPKSKAYQQIESENAAKVVGVLPELQYDKRQKWDQMAQIQIQKQQRPASNQRIPQLLGNYSDLRRNIQSGLRARQVE
ncbi:Kinase [Hexamita inflata]|uniref:non-specific serine/threonine protein kinase n=1 Tax=Hexamita inflata TaxID=28002 RepID=A0AA86UHT1_9EUKA|nr:Kinase [Hexamita inflata]